MATKQAFEYVYQATGSCGGTISVLKAVLPDQTVKLIASCGFCAVVDSVEVDPRFFSMRAGFDSEMLYLAESLFLRVSKKCRQAATELERNKPFPERLREAELRIMSDLANNRDTATEAYLKSQLNIQPRIDKTSDPFISPPPPGRTFSKTYYDDLMDDIQNIALRAAQENPERYEAMREIPPEGATERSAVQMASDAELNPKRKIKLA